MAAAGAGQPDRLRKTLENLTNITPVYQLFHPCLAPSALLAHSFAFSGTAGAGMHSAPHVHKVDVTAAAKPAKQRGWEEKEARGINGWLRSLLLAGAGHLQAWGAFRSQEA